MTDRTHYCAGCKERQDHIEKLEADNARLNDALRQAVMDTAEWARKAGEAQGKLEISEAAGVLDGWKRDCEQLRADNARLREELSGISGRLKVMREALIHTAGICNPISGFLKNLTGPRKKHLDSVQDIARAALQGISQ